ncbi:unnamed protein product [Penicillium glandicola]
MEYESTLLDELVNGTRKAAPSDDLHLGKIGIPGIWSLINVILIALKRPVHPGAHIALDLIFTVAMWFFGVLGLIDETLSYYNGYWEESRWRNMVIAGLSLMVINGFLHFVHFVLGCCDVHWRRHSSVDYNYRKGNFQESA